MASAAGMSPRPPPLPLALSSRSPLPQVLLFTSPRGRRIDAGDHADIDAEASTEGGEPPLVGVHVDQVREALDSVINRASPTVMYSVRPADSERVRVRVRESESDREREHEGE